MMATGLGFALVHDFWPLLVVAFVGTLNPSAGDVSVFLPTEQALLPQTITPEERTAALRALQSIPGRSSRRLGRSRRDCRSSGGRADADRLPGRARGDVPALRVARGGRAAALPRALPGDRAGRRTGRTHRSARRSGRFTRLAGLFSIDSLAGGFVVQSLLALWLFERSVSPWRRAGRSSSGPACFAAGSQLARAAARATDRAGQDDGLHPPPGEHLPDRGPVHADAAAGDRAPASRAALCRRWTCRTRTSYVMAVVSPAERPAAASVTNVPRSLASALGPLPAGYLLASRRSAGRWSSAGR